MLQLKSGAPWERPNVDTMDHDRRTGCMLSADICLMLGVPGNQHCVGPAVQQADVI